MAENNPNQNAYQRSGLYQEDEPTSSSDSDRGGEREKTPEPEVPPVPPVQPVLITSESIATLQGSLQEERNGAAASGSNNTLPVGYTRVHLLSSSRIEPLVTHDTRPQLSPSTNPLRMALANGFESREGRTQLNRYSLQSESARSHQLADILTCLISEIHRAHDSINELQEVLGTRGDDDDESDDEEVPTEPASNGFH